ncbi:unnamed protein product [Candida verbasci]|uniref:Structural maintenance of chromosomes protein n=1 Tax=Candida verbasci TaxID=1227364 RepID=A0A9W4XF18_9ASCO|nr:unnamed protein product [Candida verbasci]
MVKMKRKRAILPDTDDDDNNTFINNSDYDNYKEEVEESISIDPVQHNNDNTTTDFINEDDSVILDPDNNRETILQDQDEELEDTTIETINIKKEPRQETPTQIDQSPFKQPILTPTQIDQPEIKKQDLDDEENPFRVSQKPNLNHEETSTQTDDSLIKNPILKHDVTQPIQSPTKKGTPSQSPIKKPILHHIPLNDHIEKSPSRSNSDYSIISHSDPDTEKSQNGNTSLVNIDDPVVSTPKKTLLKQVQIQQEFNNDIEDIGIKISPRKKLSLAYEIPKSKEPRLVISQLVLINFKSYAGVQVIGPFHSSFSAVVGPNGSGKSNVIDSMLFVFGFRASKMRQSKLSELIHNSAGQRLDFCQVDIHFNMVQDDDFENSEIISGSELIISRKATKNNSSMYFINGKSSNYTEVTNLLKEKGIDLDHKRFLILQGEVESIAQMKAKAEKENDDGLLEYLEDIIGTTKYKKLIEDSTTQIEELNQICMEKSNRFEFVEKDKDQLEEKKMEALRFLELEKKLVNARSVQYQVKIHECKLRTTEKQKQMDDFKSELQENRETNKEILDGIEAEYQKQKEIESAVKLLVNEIENISKRRKDTSKKGVSIDEKIKNINNKLKKIQKLLESSKHEVSSSSQKHSNYTEASNQFRTEVENLNQQLEIEESKLDEIRQSLTSITSEFTKEIESLQSQLSPWHSQLIEKENAIKLTESNIQIITTQMNSTKKQLDGHRERLANIKKEGKEKENELRETEEKLTQINQQLSLGEEQVNTQKQIIDKSRSQLNDYRQKVSEAKNSVFNSQNKSQVLTSLLRLSQTGRIEGFYGRLGDLGSIDEKYDIAISTAAPGLDSMVVETVETAQACIEYLRKNKLGYANFICLNKLRKFNLSPIQTPGDPSRVKRLFDLITPTNEKFLPAFYSKMYNTLVAPDLNEAKRVAFGVKRWKVVTLDGKVVDTSGTMSGGGSRQSRGIMRLNNSANVNHEITEKELDEMDKKLQSMENKFVRANNEYEESASMLKKLQALKPETEFSLDRLKLDINSLASEKSEVSQVCKNLIAEQAKIEEDNPFEKQINDKTQELEQLKQERKHIKSEMKGYELQIAKFEQKIMDAGGVELKIQNSKVDSIKQQISIIHEKTKGDRMTIKKLENEIKRHEKIIETSLTEQKEAEDELELITESQNEITKTLETYDKKLKELDQVKEEKNIELESLKSELDEKQELINKFKSFEIEISNKIEKLDMSLRKLRSIIDQNEKSLNSIIIRDTTPYIYWLDESEQSKYNSSQIVQLSEEQINNSDLDSINSEIEELENYMKHVRIDIEILKDYGVKIVEYNERKTDLNTAVEQRDLKKDYCEDLKRKRLDEFMVGFNTISMTLKDMYRMITMGGNAELELVDSLDPFSEGVAFSVMPPKKSWRNISNLSGGEKTLSSLALVFALHTYKPTPLYVMDEIDAALDFRNVSIVANYIKERTKNAQFVVISLRNNMFELAKQLVGIYKVNNMTRSISIRNVELQEFKKLQ